MEYIYIIVPPLPYFNIVKIGFCSSNEHVLKNRYTTPYTKNVKIYLYPTLNARKKEMMIHEMLRHHQITDAKTEVYDREYLDEYKKLISMYCKTKGYDFDEMKYPRHESKEVKEQRGIKQREKEEEASRKEREKELKEEQLQLTFSQFTEDKCERGRGCDFYVFPNVIYEAYIDWCHQNHHEDQLSARKFGIRMKTEFGENKERSNLGRKRVYSGLRLKD